MPGRNRAPLLAGGAAGLPRATHRARHGSSVARKSKTKRFNGYKRHIATNLDSGVILWGAITPANRPEEAAAPGLAQDIARQGLEIDTLFIDRGYVKATLDPEACDHCELRAKCTAATPGTGRTVNIAEDERLQQRLRKHLATPRGRARLRERVGVEHRLAHLVRRQGRRARYRGVRKNLFDRRRASAIQNLEAIQRKVA